MLVTTDDTETTPRRIQFGPREDDDMPVSWAQRGLTWLRAERPQVFAAMMLAVLGVDKKRGQ